MTRNEQQRLVETHEPQLSSSPMKVRLASNEPDALATIVEHCRTNESFTSEVASTRSEVGEETESKREAGVRVGRLPSRRIRTSEWSEIARRNAHGVAVDNHAINAIRKVRRAHDALEAAEARDISIADCLGSTILHEVNVLEKLAELRWVENHDGVRNVKVVVSSNLIEGGSTSLRAEVDGRAQRDVRGIEHSEHVGVETATNDGSDTSSRILDELNTSVSQFTVGDSNTLHEVLVERDVRSLDFVDARSIVVALGVEVSRCTQIVGWDNNRSPRSVLEFRVVLCEILEPNELRIDCLESGLRHDLHLKVGESSIKLKFCHDKFPLYNFELLL